MLVISQYKFQFKKTYLFKETLKKIKFELSFSEDLENQRDSDNNNIICGSGSVSSFVFVCIKFPPLNCGMLGFSFGSCFWLIFPSQ